MWPFVVMSGFVIFAYTSDSMCFGFSGAHLSVWWEKGAFCVEH